MESILLHHPPEAAAASPVLCVKTAHFHPWSFSQTPSLHPPFGKQQIGLDKTWNCCCDWGVPLVGPGTGFYGSKAARHTADGSCSPLCRAVYRGCFSFSPSPLTELEWGPGWPECEHMLVKMETFCVPEIRGALKNRKKEAAPRFFYTHQAFVHIFQKEEPNFQFVWLVCVRIFMSVPMKNAPGLVTQHGW